MRDLTIEGRVNRKQLAREAAWRPSPLHKLRY